MDWRSNDDSTGLPQACFTGGAWEMQTRLRVPLLWVWSSTSGTSNISLHGNRWNLLWLALYHFILVTLLFNHTRSLAGFLSKERKELKLYQLSLSCKPPKLSSSNRQRRGTGICSEPAEGCSAWRSGLGRHKELSVVRNSQSLQLPKPPSHKWQWLQGCTLFPVLTSNTVSIPPWERAAEIVLCYPEGFKLTQDPAFSWSVLWLSFFQPLMLTLLHLAWKD